jgi:anti-anti-sigma regulatory factor
MDATETTTTPTVVAAQSSPTTISLPSSMSIETVVDIASEWKSLTAAAAQTLHIDGSQVERFSTPAVQLLLSLEKTVLEAGGKVMLTGATECIKQAFTELGLESFLQGLVAANEPLPVISKDRAQ